MLLSVTPKVCWEVAAHPGKPPLLADPHPDTQAREQRLVSEASPTLASPQEGSSNATAGRNNSSDPTRIPTPQGPWPHSLQGSIHARMAEETGQREGEGVGPAWRRVA